MSYTKFVTSGIFIFFLAGLCFVSVDVRADEPELYFYPKMKWNVERVNPEDGGHPICSISNQLNNGYIVEMSGNAEGFSTLNIDFRQAAFQEGLKYEVQLLVPGISRVVAPSIATKKTTITSDLTEHLEFAREISNAGVMDIQIRDNNFRLYLTGLKAKMPVYNECTSAVESVGIALNNDDDFDYVPDEASLNSASEIEQTSTNDGSGTLTKAKPVASDKPRYIDVLAEKLKKSSDNYKPVENASDAEMPDSSKVADAEPVKISNITRSNVKSPKIVRNVVTSKVPGVIDFSDKKAASRSNDVIASADDAAAQLSQIEPASGSAPGKAANYDGAGFVDMRNKISSLEKQVKLLTDQNALLDEELRSTLLDAEQERVSVSSNNWNLERATMRYNEAERQIQRLGRQLQTQRAQCELEKTELENMLFDPKLTSKKQLVKLSSIEAALENTKSEMYRQKRQYEERIKLMEQQLGAQ